MAHTPRPRVPRVHKVDGLIDILTAPSARGVGAEAPLAQAQIGPTRATAVISHASASRAGWLAAERDSGPRPRAASGRQPAPHTAATTSAYAEHQPWPHPLTMMARRGAVGRRGQARGSAREIPTGRHTAGQARSRMHRGAIHRQARLAPNPSACSPRLIDHPQARHANQRNTRSSTTRTARTTA